MSTLSLPRQFARTRRFGLGAPDQFSITADGTTVLFLRSRGGEDPVTCLWALDVPSGTERLLADPAALLAGGSEALSVGERTRRERAREQRAGIVAYAIDEAGRLAAFALSGTLWTVDTVGGQVRRLPVRGKVVDPRPDPTGRRIAYLADGALRVVEDDGTRDRAVAEPTACDQPRAAVRCRRAARRPDVTATTQALERGRAARCSSPPTDVLCRRLPPARMVAGGCRKIGLLRAQGGQGPRSVVGPW